MATGRSWLDAPDMNLTRRRGFGRPYARLSTLLQLLGAGMLAARVVRSRRHAARLRQARQRFSRYADLELMREEQARRADREPEDATPAPRNTSR
jgi:hypothetical protein